MDWADLRTGAEALNPLDYFKFRYYEKWLGGITKFFIEKGYVSEDELASRAAELTAPSAPAVGDSAIDDQVREYLRKGDSPRRDVASPEVPVGQTLLVPVLLRRLLRRRTPKHHQAIHRTTEPPRLTRTPPALAGRTNGIGFLPAVNGQASAEEGL